MSYLFQCTGTLVYSELDNPYETVKTYLNREPEGWVIKSYISEHGPEGGSSWRGIFLDEENWARFEAAASENGEAFLRKYLKEKRHYGLWAVNNFLDTHQIPYTSKSAW